MDTPANPLGSPSISPSRDGTRVHPATPTTRNAATASNHRMPGTVSAECFVRRTRGPAPRSTLDWRRGARRRAQSGPALPHTRPVAGRLPKRLFGGPVCNFLGDGRAAGSVTAMLSPGRSSPVAHRPRVRPCRCVPLPRVRLGSVPRRKDPDPLTDPPNSLCPHRIRPGCAPPRTLRRGV